MSSSILELMPTGPILTPSRTVIYRLLTLRRTGIVNANKTVMGELTIGDKTWPTMEKGKTYTHARKGDYSLEMCMKITNPRKAIRFSDPGVRALMIHDFRGDVTGCIAPGLEATTDGVSDSWPAMLEIFDKLGGWVDGGGLGHGFLRQL
jgi:hypothetical protein